MGVACLLLAAGEGRRLAAGMPKALVCLRGEPLVVHAARRVLGAGLLDRLVVVAPAERTAQTAALVAPLADRAGTAWSVVSGGATRQASVAAGLAELPVAVDLVLVHDCARCLAPSSLVVEVVAALRAGADAVVPGLAVADTVKRVDARSRVVETVAREQLRAVQTPQGFRRAALQAAHDRADAGQATDDAGLVERTGTAVTVVPGSREAFKVTEPWDLALAELLLAAP